MLETKDAEMKMYNAPIRYTISYNAPKERVNIGQQNHPRLKYKDEKRIKRVWGNPKIHFKQ